MLCYLYIRYAEYEYKSSAKIEIIDKAQDSEMALPTAVTIFNRSMINLENEKGVLNSFSLNKKAVQELKFNVKYFSSGTVKRSENHISEWTEFCDITFNEKINDNFYFNTYFEVNKKNNLLNIIHYDNNDNIIDEFNFTNNSTLIETKVIPFDLTVNHDKFFDSKKIIKIFSVDDTVSYFKSKINISQSGRDSDQLEISLTHPNKLIANDYINTLLKLFDQDGITDRQLEYKRTIDFVDSRSVYLSAELEAVENRKREFKIQNNLSDVQVDAKISADQKLSYNSELFKSKSQLDLLNMLELSLKENSFDLMPVDIGIDDSNLNSQISEFNLLIRDRDKFLISAGENNLFVKSIEKQISDYSDAIFRSISNYKNKLTINIKNLEEKETEYIDNYKNIPEFEKILRSIERELTVKESLFLLLLQKREEASINFAVVKPSIKVIDSAMSLNSPVFPKVGLIIFLGSILGFLIPSLVLFLWFASDSKIHTRDFLTTAISDIPLIGEVPFIENSDLLNSISAKNSRNSLAESVRMIIANLNFILFNDNLDKKRNNLILITSSIKGEGKTIVSTNLASLLSHKYEKVLLIGADLRNPQIHKYIGSDKSVKGLSNYIYSDNINWKDLLIKLDNLDILLSGTIPPNPTELLSSKKFENFIKEISSKYDYIIVDSAPCLLVSDTFEISNLFDTTLYVVRANHSDKKLCDFINEIHKNNRLSNMNLVLNSVGNSSEYGYKYGYQYGYNYSYKYGYNYGYGYGYSEDDS